MLFTVKHKNVIAWKLNNCIHWNTGFDILTCTGVGSCNHTLCNFQTYRLPMCWIVSWKWCEIISLHSCVERLNETISLTVCHDPLPLFHCVCVTTLPPTQERVYICQELRAQLHSQTYRFVSNTSKLLKYFLLFLVTFQHNLITPSLYVSWLCSTVACSFFLICVFIRHFM